MKIAGFCHYYHYSHLLLVLLLLHTSISNSNITLVHSMTWAATWNSIIQGGPKRWKVDDLEMKQRAMAHITEHINNRIGGKSIRVTTATKSNNDGSTAFSPLKILCPLAGDDQFVQYAWSQGHDVTAIDLVPAAVGLMRQQFGGTDTDWTNLPLPSSSSSFSDDDTTTVTTQIWSHKSGRATLYAGDMMQKRPELDGKFDVVYDKDSFGALPLELRQTYCQRLSEYCKPGAIVYTEVKNRETGKESGAGPPFHVEKADLMQDSSFGANFVHIADLGEVYPLEMSGLKQTAHILQRK